EKENSREEEILGESNVEKKNIRKEVTEKEKGMMSSTISSTNTSSNFNDSIILVLESTNDTFSTKRICLSDNTPVKIGRITNKNTHQTQTNGYFDSRVLSRTHAEIWKDNGKVFVRDLKSSNGTFVNGKRISVEDKEGDPVELKDYDLLEFGIDIYNEHDRKLLYRKIAATVQITSSSNARSRIGVIKNGSSCKRRSGLTPGVHSPDDSIYASLEFELHNARDESRHLIELNNVLNDIGNTLGNRNNRDKSDENVVIHPDFKELQTKFRAQFLNCDSEKDAVVAELNRKLEHEICLRNEYKEKSQMYEKKIEQLEENLKATSPKNLESDSKLIEELKVQVQMLSQQLESSQSQIKDANISHSNDDNLQNQLNELVSKFESLRLLHVSEVDELKYKIQEVNTELENTSRELNDLQDLYSSVTEKYEKRSSQAVIHQKQKTTVKESEWTKERDSLLLMEVNCRI
ncbi:8624_t:CDS:2, partial [Dentiscutata erythropus]